MGASLGKLRRWYDVSQFLVHLNVGCIRQAAALRFDQASILVVGPKHKNEMSLQEERDQERQKLVAHDSAPHNVPTVLSVLESGTLPALRLALREDDLFFDLLAVLGDYGLLVFVPEHKDQTNDAQGERVDAVTCEV